MIFDFLKPAPAIAPLPENEVKSVYKRYRIQVFLASYIGYMVFYFTRVSFTLAKPYLLQSGITLEELGLMGSVLGVAYGLSKFFMGSISDRSNPRYFMGVGLIASALINFIFPHMVFVFAIVCLAGVNGWVQGMGWPPCARNISHWFTQKERGTVLSLWNTSHNLGAALFPFMVAPLGLWVWHGNWHGLFYAAGCFGLVAGIFILVIGRDKPQSLGLPGIEEYKGHSLADKSAGSVPETELSSREIIFKHVLNNKYIWFLAIANIFIYCVRYGVLNWAAVYLTQSLHMSTLDGLWGYALFELPAIPATILIGWMSDRVFKGNRTPLNLLTAVGVLIGVIWYWHAARGVEVYLALAFTGLFMYGPQMLIGLTAIDVAGKKAAGTASGFTGLTGYFFGTVGAEWLLSCLVENYGWNSSFIMLVCSAVLAIVFIALTWNAHRDTRS